MNEYNQEMDTAVLKEVIITTILRRGNGKGPEDVMRIVLQVFTKDGQLIAENDPYMVRKN